MKGSNLKILPAYRMYQAPEGGGEKPVRTSYLKDLSEGSASRGGGGTGGHKLSGQKLTPNTHGQKLTGLNMSVGQCMARGIITLERAGSCPVVNTFHSTRQEPSDSRGMTKPTSETATRLFKVRHGLGRLRQSDRHTVAVIDTVTDRHGGRIVSTVDDLGGHATGRVIGNVSNDDLKATIELRAILNKCS